MDLEQLNSMQLQSFPKDPRAIAAAQQTERNRLLFFQQQLQQAQQRRAQQDELHRQQVMANIEHMKTATQAQKQESSMAPHIAALNALHRIDPEGKSNLMPEYMRQQGMKVGMSPTEQAVIRPDVLSPGEVGSGEGQFPTLGSAMGVIRQRVQGLVDSETKRITSIKDPIEQGRQWNKFKGKNAAAASVAGITLPDLDKLNLAEERSRQAQQVAMIQAAVKNYVAQQQQQMRMLQEQGKGERAGGRIDAQKELQRQQLKQRAEQFAQQAEQFAQQQNLRQQLKELQRQRDETRKSLGQQNINIRRKQTENFKPDIWTERRARALGRWREIGEELDGITRGRRNSQLTPEELATVTAKRDERAGLERDYGINARTGIPITQQANIESRERKPNPYDALAAKAGKVQTTPTKPNIIDDPRGGFIR